MKTYLLVTVTSPDRPGVIERITDIILAFSGNWEESRMAHLGGDFAGIVMVSVPQEKAQALAEALKALADDEMTVLAKFTQPPAMATQQARSLYELRLVGADHEGILHSVSRYLASQRINVETMETGVVPAPMSASPLFQMHAQIAIPPDFTHSELEANLKRIAEELGVDIDLTPA